jgi:hypothetical protein
MDTRYTPEQVAAAARAAGAARAAQTDKLREILTVGEWVEESSNEHD